MAGQVSIIRGNALELPLADNSVDLIVTSPPYFGLRSYQDGGEHYDGQIGAEATPTEFVDALLAATREMMRVLKPSGSIWVNLGDKYAGPMTGAVGSKHTSGAEGRAYGGERRGDLDLRRQFPHKSLIGIPWRYALRCIDELGLILRAEVIWSKPNGLPESVTDRVRRSHEQWFHFTKEPRYYSAVDEVRERHVTHDALTRIRTSDYDGPMSGAMNGAGNPLGKLPGSVWTIATEPLRVPDHLGIDHFAAFPTEWPRRIITGWSPREVCSACGEGRWPVVDRGVATERRGDPNYYGNGEGMQERWGATVSTLGQVRPSTITGYACACPEPTADTAPGVVLDPFGGTGTTALVASALDRHGISVDMSADYCRLAEWRTGDPKQRAKAARVPHDADHAPLPGQTALFDLGETA